ncbi:MAG: response regulator transcription factor [Candidatus Aminicenantes bacterium]|nr:response regulator transcription factor [Candidatus Aminicenantes bacterium]
MKESILLVEDDPAILTGLEDLLSGEGYEVRTARDGKAALRAWEADRPALILLDVMIPEKSGLDVCREIRLKDPLTPIVMLTAKGRETDKVIGLELGADDYIVKPFAIGELLARVRAALRRASARKTGKKDTSPIEFGGIRIDPKTFTGTKNGKPFPVTAREIELLRYFSAHAGEVVDRFTLLDEIWGVRYEGTTRTLDQHIAKLRQKIEEDPTEPGFIQTVYGVGYKFNPSGD